MARERFQGKLISTQSRPDGPIGRPMTQVMFQTVDDGTPAIAVWHEGPAPFDLQEGATYHVEGNYIYHNGRHLFFKPVVDLLESGPVQKVRHILFRPRDWRRGSKIIASTSMAIMIAAIAFVVFVGGGAASKKVEDTSQPVSSRSQSDSGSIARVNNQDDDTKAEADQDCTTRVEPFTTSTITDAKQRVGYRQVAQTGIAGEAKVCYPDGRQSQPKITVTKPPVNEIVVIGGMGASNTSGTAPKPTQPPAQQPKQQPAAQQPPAQQPAQQQQPPASDPTPPPADNTPPPADETPTPEE